MCRVWGVAVQALGAWIGVSGLGTSAGEAEASGARVWCRDPKP